MLRRGKGPTVEGAARVAGWQVFDGEYDGRPLTARFNAAFKDARDRAQYPIQIGVAVPPKEADARGMPRAPELDELAAVEEHIVTTADERAVLVGSITTTNMREFVLYTRSSDWIASFDYALQAAVDGPMFRS